MFKQCTCESKFQDRTYGSQLRVHTEGKTHATCTVCGDKKLLGSSVSKQPKEKKK